MDIFSSNYICNHSDGEGRYSYRNQPRIGMEAVHRLGAALSEMIGHELELAGNGDKIAEAQKGWADDESKLEAWRDAGDKVVEEIASEFMGTYIHDYRNLMAKVSIKPDHTLLYACVDADKAPISRNLASWKRSRPTSPS